MRFSLACFLAEKSVAATAACEAGSADAVASVQASDRPRHAARRIAGFIAVSLSVGIGERSRPLRPQFEDGLRVGGFDLLRIAATE